MFHSDHGNESLLMLEACCGAIALENACLKYLVVLMVSHA